MEQAITGSIQISDDQYPYTYDKETEKLTLYLGTKTVSVPEDMLIFVGQKYGMLTGGRFLYKLDLPLSNDCMNFEDGQPKYVSLANQVRSVEYVIENYEPNSQYKEMRLRFPELDYFIPSCGRMEALESEIVFSRAKENFYCFDIKYRGTDVSVVFEAKINCTSGVRAVAETVSEIVLRFAQTDNLDYLQGLYEDTRSFFSFICNRRNIGLRSATLIGEYPTKKIENGKIVDAIGYTKQTVCYSQKYLEPEEDKKEIAKTIRSTYFAPHIADLFQMFSEKTVDEMAMVNSSGIHHSIKYRNLIDLEQSLHITASFECYVRALLPEISSKTTIEFFAELSSLIDEYINRLTGKKKKKAENFRKSLRPQLSLSDKMTKAYKGYAEWRPLKPILAEWFGDDISDFAEAANLWRNELAHEKREYIPDEKVIYAVRLVEHMNYCIVLRKAGYNDEQIKTIVSEILIR